MDLLGNVIATEPIQLKTKKQSEVADMELWVLAAPSQEEISRLESATDKVNCVCLWIVQAIICEVRAGRLDAPPPIVTRVFQELSTGMLGFNQAHKVAMVPFPFPFAQMVGVLLATLYCALPFYLDVFTRNVVITPLVAFLLPLCYSGLNQIAIELEEPFGMDWNDVDIEVRHEDFLWALIDIVRNPTVPPVSDGYYLEQKILRGIAKGFERLTEEMKSEGLQVNWNAREQGSLTMSKCSAVSSEDERLSGTVSQGEDTVGETEAQDLTRVSEASGAVFQDEVTVNETVAQDRAHVTEDVCEI